MKQHDVAIIGAGIHGASVAHHLARAGVDTVVFERWTAAAGPTGRSSAVCRAGYTNAFLARMAREGIELFGGLQEYVGGDSGFVRTGLLYVHGSEDADRLGKHVETLTAAGVRAERLDAAALASEHPELAVGPEAQAIWEPDAGHADPAGVTRALLDDAERSGATLRERREIATVSARIGGGAILTTADGERVEAPRLVVAAGPWTGPLLRQLGVDLPLFVERHGVSLFTWAEADPLPYILADVPGGYYLKPEGPTQYGLGSALPEPEADPDDFQEEVGVEESLALAEPAIRRIPSLAASEFAGGWASLYDVSPDWQPVIGEVAEGVVVTAGTSGHGFKLAPALGREIAGLVAGTPYDAALDQFTPERFSSGTHLAAGFGAARILG